MTMIDTSLLLRQNQLLSQKIKEEYSISLRDYPVDMDRIDIVINAYKKAVSIFDDKSDDSIVTKTLSFYMSHVNEVIDSFTKGLANFDATLKLIEAFVKVQALIQEGTVALKNKFSSELINNKKYYSLFDIDYYLELSRTEGLEYTLSELEDDVNSRANTYYNTTYKEYLDILPGFETLINFLNQ